MIGLVPAAGAGSRLRPYTDTLPKALVPLDDDRTILDITLRNFAEVEMRDVAIIVGYCADAIRERKTALEQRHGVKLHLIENPKAERWNNAYTVWCARELFREGVILANSDTIHPSSVERTLLDANARMTAAGQQPGVLLALDTVKKLADEEMKVTVDPDKGARRITKLMDPADATGEYIGVTLINPSAADDLASALQATYERDPQLYYEDGYQEMIDRGLRIDVQPIGEVSWVEVDNHEDLAKGREIACRY
ncbi:choline kinase [Streptacidiphilus sp. MAP12-20]|uniref:phosphocholine cytidylyltransferase family protein n=1 Tax=Streptacidiphilus sp. MAP12-20 TaxID=3156299 RepID=UPI0035165279